MKNLFSAALRYAAISPASPAALNRLADQLRLEIASHPLIRRIGVVDRDGVTALNTALSKSDTQRPSVANRDYFLRAKGGEQGMIFEGPVRVLLDGDWALVLARRIEDESGNFLGAVIAVLPTTGIAQSLSKIELGPLAIVNLRSADLAQIARSPALPGANTGIGNRNVSQTIRQLMRDQPAQDHYVYTAVAPIDGIERLYVYQKLDRAPLWMTVGIARADFSSSWHRTAILLALICPLIAWLLFWSAHRVKVQNDLLRQELARAISDGA